MPRDQSPVGGSNWISLRIVGNQWGSQVSCEVRVDRFVSETWEVQLFGQHGEGSRLFDNSYEHSEKLRRSVA